MENPNKYIRKYFYDTLNGIVVQGQTVKVYDSHTPNNDNFLIILSTQTGVKIGNLNARLIKTEV